MADLVFNDPQATGNQTPPPAAPDNTPPGKAESGADAVPSQTTTEPAALPAWLESLPPELKSNEALKAYADPSALAKDFLDIRQKYEAVGKPPENPDQYDVKLPEGMTPNPSAISAFKAMAHKAGFSQAQVEAVLAFNAESGQAMLKEEQAKRDEWLKTADEAIRKQWGADYERNNAVEEKAKTAMAQAEPGLHEYLTKHGLDKDPAIRRFFHLIGTHFSEGTLISFGERMRPPVKGPTDEAGRLRIKYASMGDK